MKSLRIYTTFLLFPLYLTSTALADDTPRPGLIPDGKGITLREAITRSLLLNPTVRLQESTVISSGGAVQQAEGQFDVSVQARNSNEKFVANKRKLYQAGFALLFELVQIENTLTQAQISEVTSNLEYAVAISNLQYQIEATVPANPENPRVNMDKLIFPPSIAALEQ